jgi:hypothetical protein
MRLDRERLACFPGGYRHLAYLQTQIGYDIKGDMSGLVGAAASRLITLTPRGSRTAS